MKKRILSILLTLLLTAQLLPVSALAAVPDNVYTVEVQTHYNPLYPAPAVEEEGPISIDLAVPREAAAYVSREEALDVARAQMINRDRTITAYYVSDTYQTQDDFDRFFEDALDHCGNPEAGDSLRWVIWTYSVGGHSSKVNGQHHNTVSFTLTYYTDAAKEQELTAAVDSTMASFGFTSGTSEYLKAKTIYDYICANVSYDHEHVNNDGYKPQFTAHAAMIQNVAVCQGYAILFYRMALEAGLDARVVTGGNHAWNIVRIDGIYYNVDSTWDAGRSDYRYFLKGSEDFPGHIREVPYCDEPFTVDFPTSPTNYDPNTAQKHNVVVDIAVDPTCTETGLTQGMHCADCGETIIAQVVIPPYGHSFIVDRAVAPTCTTDGWTEGSYCSVCDLVQAPQTRIPATGHTVTEGKCDSCGIFVCAAHEPVSFPGYAATCTTDGKTDGTKCSKCGAFLTLRETIPAAGHKYENGSCVHCGHIPCDKHQIKTIPGFDATCTVHGLSDGKECSLCGLVLVPQTQIPAKDHQIRTISGQEPDCTTIGISDHSECTLCGEVMSAAEILPPLGHEYENGKCIRCGRAGGESVSGTCGDDLTWKLDGDSGKLTISGNGPLWDFTEGTHTNPWEKYANEIRTLVVEKGVTELTCAAFMGCGNLAKVSLPKSLRVIGINCFAWCFSLSDIKLPNGLQTIENGAFTQCNGIKQIQIPKSVTSLGEGVFGYCAGMQAITVDDGNTQYTDVDGALLSKDKRILYAVPTAFKGTYVVPDGVTEIATMALIYCEGITAVSLPDTLTKIGSVAFRECNNLQTVIFRGVPAKYEAVTVEKGNDILQNAEVKYEYTCTHQPVTDPAVPSACGRDGLTEGSHCALCGEVLKVQEPIIVPDHILQWGVCTICGTNTNVSRPMSEGVTWTLDEESGLLTISGKGSMGSYTESEEAPWNESLFDRAAIQRVVIEEGITDIGAYAFYDCENLTEVSIPDTVTKLGQYAFSMSGLTSVDLPPHISVVQDYAFYSCVHLNEVKLNEGLTHIGRSGFDWCYDLKNIELPSTLQDIGMEAFAACTGLLSLDIPDSVTSIGASAFDECSSLRSLKLPAGLTMIPRGMCSLCKNLEEIEFPKELKVISGASFNACRSLTYLEFPQKLESIGDQAFYACDNLSELYIYPRLKKIEDNAFLDCESLKDVYFSGSQKQWDDINIMSPNGTLLNATLHLEYDFTDPNGGNRFSDVNQGHYFYDAVMWAVDQNITSGTSGTTFSPDQSCTRGQVVTFLYRAAGSPEYPDHNKHFGDVYSIHYFYEPVMWAVGQGITGGTSATMFSPDQSCTRGQVVTFLWAAAGKPEPNSNKNPFTDITQTDYFYKAVLWAVEQGITSGTSATTFSPDAVCTRGQVVTFLWRANM